MKKSLMCINNKIIEFYFDKNINLGVMSSLSTKFVWKSV